MKAFKKFSIKFKLKAGENVDWQRFLIQQYINEKVYRRKQHRINNYDIVISKNIDYNGENKINDNPNKRISVETIGLKSNNKTKKIHWNSSYFLTSTKTVYQEKWWLNRVF